MLEYGAGSSKGQKAQLTWIKQKGIYCLLELNGWG